MCKNGKYLAPSHGLLFVLTICQIFLIQLSHTVDKYMYTVLTICCFLSISPYNLPFSRWIHEHCQQNKEVLSQWRHSLYNYPTRVCCGKWNRQPVCLGVWERWQLRCTEMLPRWKWNRDAQTWCLPNRWEGWANKSWNNCIKVSTSICTGCRMICNKFLWTGDIHSFNFLSINSLDLYCLPYIFKLWKFVFQWALSLSVMFSLCEQCIEVVRRFFILVTPGIEGLRCIV